jgi:AraC-like DNA-binding protein
MCVYQERASRVAGAAVWRRLVAPDGTLLRVLPDGCMDLIWQSGRLFVVGADTVARLVRSPAGISYIALRLPPGVGPAVFGLPASQLRDRTVPLADVWPAALARRAADAVHGAERPGVALEEVALARLAESPPDPLVRLVAARLGAGHPVADVAAEVGLSERQLHRRSLAAFGYGPKTLARILRLQHALALANGDRALPGGAVAAEAGYADQAHLAREVRTLAGVAFGALRSASARPRLD